MSVAPLVSIIIPTFNRAHLIRDTLDSIKKQTYLNWECIIVDDGSSDNTREIVESYMVSDKRFKFFNRPSTHLPGGNGARNYGFSKSTGFYINWFDSDDLMESNFLDSKVLYMSDNNLDFAVSKTINFNVSNDFKKVKKYRLNHLNNLDILNFINQKVYWMTPDFFVKRDVVRDIRFSEVLKSGQETNFFIKFLTLPVKGGFIDQVLTKRRIHDDTIRKSVEVDKVTSNRFKALSLLDAYLYIYDHTDSKILVDIENHILRAMYRTKFDIPLSELNSFSKRIKQHRGLKQFINLKLLISFSKIGKGYSFFNRFQNYG